MWHVFFADPWESAEIDGFVWHRVESTASCGIVWASCSIQMGFNKLLPINDCSLAPRIKTISFAFTLFHLDAAALSYWMSLTSTSYFPNASFALRFVAGF